MEPLVPPTLCSNCKCILTNNLSGICSPCFNVTFLVVMFT